MTKCLILGQTNAGKTCFTLNFADYLGLEELKLTVKKPAGFLAEQTYCLDAALEELVSEESHKTEEIQKIKLKLPAGKTSQQIELIDTCGLVEGIHPDKKIRKAMAQTLAQIESSELILHIIDLLTLEENSSPVVSKVDQEIYNYCQAEKCYAVLANKIDVDRARRSLELLYNDFSSGLIIPISALYRQGFEKVKSFILKNL
ncbi:GTPase domain-containing protein [Fuchsiella alkaliacetigena]|uniref:GTPase domain-containing protein n=1 Tax=Fuchsiella alkaliacetigena TaxID=957042 RepID=UPI00200A9DB7|nr:GTPase domain-containing protein [Fuchsiella alkaliacetigena]MCK8825024.1 GTPase domain-containing protein [Fuchsiella alkaliacetigena]